MSPLSKGLLAVLDPPHSLVLNPPPPPPPLVHATLGSGLGLGCWVLACRHVGLGEWGGARVLPLGPAWAHSWGVGGVSFRLWGGGSAKQEEEIRGKGVIENSQRLSQRVVSKVR